ncbi:polyketide synthase dehydratase domain-containing protein [Streptomyces thinghirensis]|nr:polyketide synthase dehydratase domain-containing protein [Streptomyces thinghirensis]
MAAAGLDTAGHPLVGAVVPLPGSGGVLATGRLAPATSPWLADHQVSGAGLVPGAALVDLVIGVGDEVGAGVVEELVIEAPLVVGDRAGTRIQIAVAGADEAGRREVSVYGAAEGGTWTRHAHGTLVERGTGADFALGQWPPADAVPVDIGDFYERQAESGLEYGPLFQGLTACVAAWCRGLRRGGPARRRRGRRVRPAPRPCSTPPCTRAPSPESAAAARRALCCPSPGAVWNCTRPEPQPCGSPSPPTTPVR